MTTETITRPETIGASHTLKGSIFLYPGDADRPMFSWYEGDTTAIPVDQIGASKAYGSQRVIVPEPFCGDVAYANRDMLMRDNQPPKRRSILDVKARPAARPVRSPLQIVAPMERMAGGTRWGAA